MMVILASMVQIEDVSLLGIRKYQYPLTVFDISIAFFNRRHSFRAVFSPNSREGASIFGKPPTHDVERFLFILRFDSREK